MSLRTPTMRCWVVAFVLVVLRCAAAGVCTARPVVNVFPTDTNGSTAPPLTAVVTNPFFYPFVQANLAQRMSDVLVTDDGEAPNCFVAGNVFTFTYPMRITVPAALSAAN